MPTYEYECRSNEAVYDHCVLRGCLQVCIRKTLILIKKGVFDLQKENCYTKIDIMVYAVYIVYTF